MAANNRTLAWRIPWEPGRLQSMVSQRVRHNWATSLFFSLLINSSKEFGCEGGAVIWVEADGKCETRKSFYFYFSEGKINTLMLLCKLFFILFIIHISTCSVSSFQLFSHVWYLATSWTTGCQAPCPSPNPGVYSNSCPWSWWCHPTISASVIPFSSCLQSFQASGSFPMS